VAAKPSLIQLAVFGSPITQSKSPVIHRQFAAQLGLQVNYLAIESGVAEFPERLEQFVATGARGCNITAPLKQAAFQSAHEVSEVAARAQAVNTLVIRDPGYFYGTTTDGGGLLNDLKRFMPASLQGIRILVVGAGGAAAGVLGTLLQESPETLVVANRSSAKADQLCQRFADLGPVRSCELAELDQQAPFDLLINATSLGHQGLAPELPGSCFATDSLCYDLNYGPAAKPWQQACEAGGRRFSDGLGMLVEQAALSFELWTGQTPQTQSVLEELRASLG
jgi:shikimate dehydrogenase